MIVPSASSSGSGRSSSPDGKPSEQPSNVSLHESRYRWVPYIWQVGGTTASVAGYVVGSNGVVDVVMHIAVLSFVTAAYLSLFVRERRRPEDIIAIVGYLVYGAFLGLVSAPSLYQLGPLATPARTLGLLCGGLLLSLTWLLFVEYLVE